MAKDNVDLIVWMGESPTYHRNIPRNEAHRLSRGLFDGKKCKVVERTPRQEGVSCRTQRWGIC